MTSSTKKKLVCIACPLGCRLEVEDNGCGEITVLGNQCKRGETYAREEIFSPKRTVTAIMKTNSKTVPFVPVRTNKPLPKALINKLLKRIYAANASVPIQMGQTAIENFSESGVDVIFTRTVRE